MKKIVIILLILLTSCGLFRGKIHTVTVHKTYIDTVIIIQRDTVLKKDSAYIMDTAYLDTPDFTALSYVDTVFKKIFIEGKAKIIEVPVRIESTNTTETTAPEPKKNNFWTYFFIGVSGTLFLITMILFLITMNKK